MAEFDPQNPGSIEEYVGKAIQTDLPEHGSRTWELAKKVSPALRMGAFAARNWGVFLGLVVGGGVTAASLADMVRIPPEKRVEIEGAVQAVWSVTEIDILQTDGFAYASAKGDSAAFEPMGLIEGAPRIVMKYAPEQGRYISYEVVNHPVIGEYIRIAEYDAVGNAYGLNYDNPIFHALLPEECALEIIGEQLKPDGSCANQEDPDYRGVIDHDIVYPGYPLLDDLSIVSDTEVGYNGAVEGLRNCIARTFFGGVEYVQNPDGTSTPVEKPILAYHNLRSAEKAILIADLASALGIPVFDENGLRRILFPDDEERLEEAIATFEEKFAKGITAEELRAIFSLDQAPLPVGIELHPLDMGRTTGEILLELKESVPEIQLPEGLTQETARTHSVNSGCVPVSEESQKKRLENHEFAARYGAEMVGMPLEKVDGKIMPSEEAEQAYQRVFGR